ncbi:MAG: DUF960 family protein [Romboutsia timonensis]|uniref:DUF960 family protein n=1 Tax=Romboutsia timonensis TaxID=1776391 RepID=UPI002A756E9B|nr:DUF960 family protein [Romboutsia timonensis]MDY3000166.1 DUF960 family protein [Romboutsia timonensis]
MFNIDKKYMTIGIKENLGIDMQLFIWSEIEKRINLKEDVDYLQVFNIKIVDEINDIVEIEHTQEIPKYKNISVIKSKGVKNNLKVFVILELEAGYATMLLATEY